jgi:hypothetical protein
MRTNHPTLLLSPDTPFFEVPAVHRVVLSAEICYESSIRIQVSGSESGVAVSGVLCGAVMNVQSPVGRMESRSEMEIGVPVLSTRCESNDPENAGVGGNDCGISMSVLMSVWIVMS